MRRSLDTRGSILTLAALAALAACGGAPPPPPTPAPPPARVAVVPVPPPPAPPAGKPRSWESWTTWGYLEAGSLAFRERLDETWGGLAKVGRGQLALLSLDAQAGRKGADAFTVTRAAVRAFVDDTRPTRLVARRAPSSLAEWAILFAATAPAATTPVAQLAICRTSGSEYAVYPPEAPRPAKDCASCAYVARGHDRALVCGMDAPSSALRDDYLARGLEPSGPSQLHAEQHDGWNMSPTRVVLDASADGGTLRATLHLTPRQASTTSVSPAALAAATRVLPLSPRIEVGQQWTGGEVALPTPLSFEGFKLTVPTAGGPYDATFGDLTFVESSTADVARHATAQWRALNGNGSTSRVDATPAPHGFPKGTLRFRVREWFTNSGDVMRCTPQQRQMGGCTVVGHEPRKTTLSHDGDMLLVPGDGGTWIGAGGDPGSIAALLQLLTSQVPVPAVWKLPALALGKDSTAGAELWWARHALADGDELVELEGHVRP